MKKLVDEAVKVAKSDTEISLKELASDVYAAPLEGQIRGTAPFKPLVHVNVGPAVNLR